MRYLGIALGMAMALGYCAAFGTLMPPFFRGELGRHRDAYRRRDGPVRACSSAWPASSSAAWPAARRNES